MPFFGVPSGFKDMLGAVGRAAGSLALSGAKSMGEEIMSQVRPVVMSEIESARSAARGMAKDIGADAARLASTTLRNVTSSARGYMADGVWNKPFVPSNDVAAMGDRVRSSAGAIVENAKARIRRVGGAVAGAGASVLDKAAERLDSMGDRAMNEQNAIPLMPAQYARNDKKSFLPNDVSARRMAKKFRNQTYGQEMSRKYKIKQTKYTNRSSQSN